MNREILFRGKRTDNGKWVYGFFNGQSILEYRNDKGIITRADKNTHAIMRPSPVDIETVGQYTGLTDKNGQKIFEGDIVKAVYQSNCVGVANIDFGIGVVEYADSYYGGARYHINIIGDAGTREFISSLDGGVKVIGNIHDNPEFLEVQHE